MRLTGSFICRMHSIYKWSFPNQIQFQNDLITTNRYIYPLRVSDCMYLPVSYCFGWLGEFPKAFLLAGFLLACPACAPRRPLSFCAFCVGMLLSFQLPALDCAWGISWAAAASGHFVSIYLVLRLSITAVFWVPVKDFALCPSRAHHDVGLRVVSYLE